MLVTASFNIVSSHHLGLINQIKIIVITLTRGSYGKVDNRSNFKTKNFALVTSSTSLPFT